MTYKLDALLSNWQPQLFCLLHSVNCLPKRQWRVSRAFICLLFFQLYKYIYKYISSLFILAFISSIYRYYMCWEPENHTLIIRDKIRESYLQICKPTGTPAGWQPSKMERGRESCGEGQLQLYKNTPDVLRFLWKQIKVVWKKQTETSTNSDKSLLRKDIFWHHLAPSPH